MVKLLTLLAMIIDHTNAVSLSPAWLAMYAIGRMAFPLFTLNMGDERTAHPGTTAEKSQSVVDLGTQHAAGVQPSLLASPALVEHSFRVRRRHTAYCPAIPVRPEKNAYRRSALGPHDLATAAGKLRAGRNYAGHQYDNLIRQRYNRSEATGSR